jgi:hypothetical protein
VKLGLGQLADEPLGERPFLVADLGVGALVDLGRVVHLVGEVEPLEEEPVLMHPDRDRSCLAARGEPANSDPVRSLEGLGKYAIAARAILAGAEVVGVLEVDGVDRALRDERIDDERRRGRLLERFQLLRLKRSTRPWRSRTL